MVEIVCTNKKNFKKEYPKGTSLAHIAEDLNVDLANPILAAKVNNEIKTLDYEVYRNKVVSFIDASSIPGYYIYVRSLYFLLYKAAKDIYPNEEIVIKHSISGGKYCEFDNPDFQIDSEGVNLIKWRMQELVAEDVPFQREQMLTQEAVELYNKKGLADKKDLLDHRPVFFTSVYHLKDTTNYFFGVLLPSTKYLTVFDLLPYESGLLLQTPSRNCPTKLSIARKSPKLFTIFKEHKEWNRILGVPYVGDLNKAVLSGESTNLLLTTEALQEKKIVYIADDIINKDDVKIVLISGPSSSGKTTTSKRISVQLRVAGLKPVQISLDNYFVEREKTPKDEKGEYDFEHIDAIDHDLFNQQLHDLFAGKEIQIPTFDFQQGKKIWKGNTLKLEPKSILVIEGIHCLNPILTQSVDKKYLYKIFISALTSIAMDRQNPINSNDNRLIRRMIRDHRYRGYSAQESLKRWISVRNGEEKWIYPFQEEADSMFNSAILCELSILKRFALPLLDRVPEIADEYTEALRLKKLLDYFIEIPEKDVPRSSILREFFGGSVFQY